MDPSFRSPRSDTPTDPVAQTGRSGSDRAPLVLLAGLGAVVAAAIGLAQAFPPAASPAPIASPVAAASSPVGTPRTSAPASREPGVPAPPRLRAAELVAGVRDGSLDGRLVYADATLTVDCRETVASPCASPDLAIDGLALDVGPGAMGVALGAPPDRAVLVLAVVGDRLVYLGPLIVHLDGSPALSEVARIADAGPGTEPAPAVLTDVRGWLVEEPCLAPFSGPAPCRVGTFLADDEPLAEAAPPTGAMTAVRVADDAWGVDRAPGAVLGGPYLVQRVTRETVGDPTWEVVARYDPSRSVRVVIP